MKKVKGLICVLLLLLIVGCESSKGELVGKEKELSNDVELVSVLEKEVTMIEAQKEVSFKDQSDNYRLQVNVFGEFGTDEDRIIYDIIVDEPKNYMKDVAITGLINSEMKEFLKADSLGFSNIAAINQESSSVFTLDPKNNEVKGITSSRAFLLDENAVNIKNYDKFVNDIKVKVTWTDEAGKVHNDYIKPSNSLINIDKKAKDYYK
ncbi:hypothetical protein KDN24_15570 [Bacillus sp. Bva_UNVM-123]|uniref:hypothetical protein n=1 Tax=Bacillus sp. Bva_UNVM-123 TaxID=2829798 RepID=UPI00391F941A